MPIDDRTLNRDYPKPSPDNLLNEDVLRLRDALDDIDGDVAAVLATLLLKAAINSPAFTGTPSAPTPAADDISTLIATTAFVLGQASSSAPVIDGSASAGTSPRFSRGDHRHPTDTSRAPLNSPALTGAPTAPTPDANDDSTKIATTAWVLLQAYVKATRQVFAGTGLTGGGDLSANRTISADVATQAEAEAGISSSKLMTPQRTAQAIAKRGLSLGLAIALG
jgi:hypothetical protein